MSSVTLALRHRRACLFAAVVLAAAGFAIAPRLPEAVYPEVSFQREQVVATVPGASAATMMAGVTRPLEAELGGIPGLAHVRSQTIRGATELSLRFDAATSMAEAHGLVTARLAELRGQLPPGAEIIAQRVLPSNFPILSINVEGPLPPERLYELAMYTVRPALAALPGAGLVTVQSSDVPEVQVVLDPARLVATHLSASAVADRLRDANVVVTAARSTEAHEQVLSVVTGELRTTSDVAAAVVGGTPAAPVHVRDLGQVREGVAPRTSLVRVDGAPGPVINVARQLSADAVVVDAAVRAKLAELAPALPAGVRFVPVYAQAEFVAGAVTAVRNAVLIGALCAVLVLALFLRNLRATLVSAAALPLTLGLALLALEALGQSFNLMTLGGLAVSVGLVIDDAVVIIEAIHRRLEAGFAPEEAARLGAADLLWPVVGTTATTLVVFLPLALLAGVTGQFFSALALAVGAAVLLSLPVALFVLPGIAAALLRPTAHQPSGKLEALYLRALAAATPRRGLLASGIAVFVVVAMALGLRLDTGFLPEADEGSYVLDYRAPIAASLSDADALVRKLEAIVRATPEVESFSRRLGTELGPPVATLTSRGDIAVRLRASRDRGIQNRSMEEIFDAQRREIAAQVPGVQVEFMQVLADVLNDLQGTPDPIELLLFGPDPEELRKLAVEAARRIRDVPGLVDFFDGDEGCMPERDLRVDPEAAARHGLSTAEIGDQLAAADLGVVATRLRRPDHLVDLRVLARPSDAPGDALLTGGVAPVLGSTLWTPEQRCLPARQWRDSQSNMVHLTARLEGADLGHAVAGVRQRLAGWKLPEGYTWQIGGLAEQQRESFRGLLEALLLGLVAVTAVLLFQLRSFARSAAVLAAVPVALAAAALTLWVTGGAINLSSLMGAIVLVGLAVKNGILLLDHAMAREAEGVPRVEALQDAARVRLRPILMTTLATLAALLPLGLGLGAASDLHRPLAVVVLGGLSLSTLATLFLVPLAALGRSGRKLGVTDTPG